MKKPTAAIGTRIERIAPRGNSGVGTVIPPFELVVVVVVAVSELVTIVVVQDAQPVVED